MSVRENELCGECGFPAEECICELSMDELEAAAEPGLCSGCGLPIDECICDVLDEIDEQN